MPRLELAVLWIALALVIVATGTARAAPVGERHARLQTDHGAIHVWTPRGYDPETAATVIYVHGYFVDVDEAWSTYGLGDQFRASHLNAMFVACEAPQSERDNISWPFLGALLETLEARDVSLPAGRLVVMGHSGAHRTIGLWLDDPRIDTIVLLDAAYGDLASYASWLEIRSDRRLFDVGDFTRPATDIFHATLPQTYTIDRFPRARGGGLPDDARTARIVYVRSWMGHMELVTRRIAIPMILRALSVPALSMV